MEQSFGDIVLSIFNIAIIGGIALTIFMIVFQGINVLNSRGDPSAFSRAKEKIKNILIGLAVLLLSYVLLYTINPNILNLELNIGEINITPPAVITPYQPPVKELDTYTFEEIPLGTITEAILAGVSSVDIPCYQYETKLKDAHGNIIVGNVVDQNKDGKIDEKDILLNKDLFYCTKLLTDAYAAKIEYHLSSLTKELDSLMDKCTCSRSYTGRYEGADKLSDHGSYGSYLGSCTTCSCSEDGSCSCSTSYRTCSNSSWWSYCYNCCGNADGCPQAPENKGGNPYSSIGSFKQYKYDPCPNRLELKCKSEEIEWLTTGSKPSEICFSQGLIKNTSPEAPILLTLNDGIKRMEFFRNYYQNHLNNLSEAKLKMKIPWGERITLAEFNKIQGEAINYKIEKTTFKDYDISRYCRNFNSSGVVDVEPCKIIDGQREYFYDGDEATFYFSSDYNTLMSKIKKTTGEKKCSVIEGEMEKGFYSGVIPIGEAVDEAEYWGKEVIRRIDFTINESKAIRDQAILIPPLQNSCASNRCKSGNPWFGKCYSDCHCSSYSCYTHSCLSCISSTCFGVCPIENFCDIVNKIYYWEDDFSLGILEEDGEVEIKHCFEATNDPKEHQIRSQNMNKMGLLQKFKEYSNRFLELSDMKINHPFHNIGDLSSIIDNICSPCKKAGLVGGKFKSCDSDLSIKVESRFDILEKLSYSRKKFTGCVKGYGAGYKDNPTEVIEVISCMEGITEPGVLILPEFPYPGKGNVNPPYNNCYPQNSDRLTEDQKSQCFYNPLREGAASNPGCLLITKEYMDNYYCCN